MLDGTIEIDETYVGGRFKNMHGDKRHEARQRVNMGKTIVAGARERDSGRVAAEIVSSTDRKTLMEFLNRWVVAGSTVYHDELASYNSMPFRHSGVNHSGGQYVDGATHTNGIESFWAILKRAYIGIYHHMSPKHLQRYVNDLCGRTRIRGLDTIDQMASIVRGMEGQRLTYADLVGTARR